MTPNPEPRIMLRLLYLLGQRGHVAMRCKPDNSDAWKIRFEVSDDMTGLTHWEYLTPTTPVADLWWLTPLPKGAP
jgi:hypothetical protein